MPILAQIRYAPSDAQWFKDIDELGNKERLQRKLRIDEAWLYYQGDHPEPLKIAPGQPDYNVILNLCGAAVDTMVAFMKVPTFDVAGGTQRAPNAAGLVETTKSREQALVEQLWTGNRLKLFLVNLLMSGFVSGHNYVKLIPQGTNLPHVELIDPRYMTSYWVGSETTLFYRMKWQIGDETRIQDIVPDWLEASERPLEERDAMGLTPFQPQRWWIIEYVEQKGGGWQEAGRDEWPYPFAPMVDWKNWPAPYLYYGLTDLRASALRNNNATNFTASNTQKIIFHHGGPQTVVTGGKLGDDIDSGPGTVIDDLPAEAKVYNLEMASDLSNSMNFMNTLRGAVFDQLHVVDRASIKDKLGQLTNFTVKLLYGDQIDAADLKRTLYGEGLVEVTKRALLMAGAPVDSITANWPESLPQDQTAKVNSVKVEHDMGLTSGDTLLKDLGRDPQHEAELKAQERDQQQTGVAEMLIGLGQRGLLGAGGGQQRMLGAGGNRG